MSSLENYQQAIRSGTYHPETEKNAGIKPKEPAQNTPEAERTEINYAFERLNANFDKLKTQQDQQARWNILFIVLIVILAGALAYIFLKDNKPKIIEKVVEKIVEKPIYRDKIVEKPIYREVFVDKPIIKEKYITKTIVPLEYRVAREDLATARLRVAFLAKDLQTCLHKNKALD